MQIINTTKAATPKGHYSQAVKSNGMVFISGQLPVSPDGSHNFELSFEKQAEIALANLAAVLRSAEATVSDILKVTVYITDMNQWQAFNGLYEQFLGAHKPARSVVPVKELHHGYQIEIEAVAEIS